MTDNSLREEINNILYNNDDLDESLEQIIKVIEKRIDGIKDEALKHESIIKVSDPNNSKWQLGYCKGVLMMKNMVKEMLK